MNLLEYLLWNNLKLGKILIQEINTICLGIYFLNDLVIAESAQQMQEEGKDIVDIESLGMWIRDTKGLWPFSIYLYGLIFDEASAEGLLEVINKYDLIGFQDVKCLVDGNEL